MNRELITLESYRKMNPKTQGYAVYMQADLPGSELKEHRANPYAPGTGEYDAWNEGQRLAVQDVQDGEE